MTNSSQDRAYIALLGLAEHFRTTRDIKKAISCLEALFSFSPPLKVKTRTHLQLGQLLFTYTNNIDLARTHLEQAWTLSQQIDDHLFDDIKYDAVYSLAQLYVEQNQSHIAKTILRKAIENSQHHIYHHSRLLLMIAVIFFLNNILEYVYVCIFFSKFMRVTRNTASLLSFSALV